MPRQRLLQKVYTHEDFENAADVIERIIIHLDDPKKFALREQERRHLQRLRIVFGVMINCNTQRERIRRISLVVPVSDRTVVRLMDDAKVLFADMMKVDRDFEKHYLKEKMMALSDKAEKQGDIDTASRLLAQVIKLQGYDREDGGLKEGQLTIPIPVFTNNAKALTPYEDAEVIEDDLLQS